MFISKIEFFQNLYLEELAMIETKLTTFPTNKDYVDDWKEIAFILEDIRLVKERSSV
jgi:hypothetical protein